MLNILGGTVPINSSEFRKFEKELRILTDKATSTDKRGKILASQRGGQLLLLIASPVLSFCLEKIYIEEFVLIPKAMFTEEKQVPGNKNLSDKNAHLSTKPKEFQT